MTKTIKTLALLLFIWKGHFAFGQTKEEIALTKAREAIELIDLGKVDEGIKLLEEAQKFDPDNLDYFYELAYAYYIKEDYKEAIKILKKKTDHKHASAQVFQLLGNSYHIIGKTDKAIEAYDEGLKKFPDSGILYLEKGNVYFSNKEYNKALPYYEKGIEVNPEFPSNYYRATQIYCHSTEEVWGMIYGEIFMNLERNSKRTVAISKLLYDTYKSQIQFTSDTSVSVSFCKTSFLDIEGLKDPNKLKLPFGIMVYEPVLLMSILEEKSIDINTLDSIRTKFIELYFRMEHDKKYPNALFDYQNKILKAGHLEAYNHWILMKGEEEGFDTWQAANQDKWGNFVKWFNDNGLEVNQSNKFYSGQY